MPLHLPGFETAIAQATGAATSTSIPVGGILSGSELLAVIEHDGGTSVAGLDPAAFTASDGAIESASLDTSGSYLLLVFTRG